MIERVQLYKPRKPRETRVKRPRKRVSGKKRPKTPKKLSVSKLTKQADKAMSDYVRQKYADKDGIATCYTCGHKNHWRKLQNGHYVSRFYKATRWSEDNCRVQCMMCNMWKRGDLITFRVKLVKELGEGGVQYLEESRKVVQKLTPEFLSAKIAEYTQKLAAFGDKHAHPVDNAL